MKSEYRYSYEKPEDRIAKSKQKQRGGSLAILNHKAINNYVDAYCVLIKVLIKAGFKIGANSASHNDILAALLEYKEKHNAMLEHILMQKTGS